MTRRQGRRRKKPLDDLKDRRGYSHLKEEALDRTVWRNRYRGGFGPVVRQNTELMKFQNNILSRIFIKDPHFLFTVLKMEVTYFSETFSNVPRRQPVIRHPLFSLRNIHNNRITNLLLIANFIFIFLFFCF